MSDTLTSYAIGMTALAALALLRVGVERARERFCRRAAGDPAARAAMACLGCGSHVPDAGESTDG
jgi:hypothetical protein